MSKKKKAAKKATKKIVRKIAEKQATHAIAIRTSRSVAASDDIHVHAALTQGGNVGALGLLPITLSDKAELALSEAVNVEDIRVKPTGQAYLCLDPSTRVLTSDLRWVAIEQLKIGDELIGVDEHLTGLRHRRKMRPSTITGLHVNTQMRYLVTFESGREVICSAEHKWLTRRTQNVWQWRPLRAVKVGDKFWDMGEPWSDESSREAGWLSGIYDGEGALCDTQTPRPGDHPDKDGTRGRFGVFFSQNEGFVLNETMFLLDRFGFSQKAPRRHGGEKCRTVEITGLYNCMRFLGSIRPIRLLNRAEVLWKNKTFMGCDATVASIEPIGEGAMIDITTSTATFFAEGMVSHNSHPTYTRWFNKAFGRLGWSLVPQSIPQVDKNGKRAQVMVLYTLYVGGKPAVSAYGEQEYFEDSSEQSRGDALEATVASALRRCAKRMGVGLEMWDKAYLDRFMKEACVKVKVRTSKWDRNENKKVDKLVLWWRRRVDVAFPGEVGQVSQEEMGDDDSQRRGGYVDEYEPRAEAKRPAAPAQPRDERLITEPQRKRLYTIANNTGRTNAVVKAWLKTKYGVDSSTQIKWRDYDAIIAAIEAEGALPL